MATAGDYIHVLYSQWFSIGISKYLQFINSWIKIRFFKEQSYLNKSGNMPVSLKQICLNTVEVQWTADLYDNLVTPFPLQIVVSTIFILISADLTLEEVLK